MSIINGMHKDLDISAQVQPMLSGLPKKKSKQKIILLSLVALLITCAVVLSVMIFLTENEAQKLNIAPLQSGNQMKIVKTEMKENVFSHNNPEPLLVSLNSNNGVKNTGVVTPNVEATHSTVKNTIENKSPLILPPSNKREPKIVSTDKQKTQQKHVVSVQEKLSASSQETLNAVAKQVESQNEQVKKQPRVVVPEATRVGHLKIEKAQLSNLQLANIHLQEASKAQAKGNNNLAARKWQKALQLQPDLNEVRKSLAMYYYSQNEVNKTTSLLKKGALISPQYSDFNLMLSRIALKENDPQKALLYLEQNPPNVKGHMDYYVSYAILAQKFSMYERSESLYRSLLTQRPNNGRWLMSLAIAQDKQDKKSAAIDSYQKALKKTDLSIKAKDYIRKRLVFLSKE